MVGVEVGRKVVAQAGQPLARGLVLPEGELRQLDHLGAPQDLLFVCIEQHQHLRIVGGELAQCGQHGGGTAPRLRPLSLVLSVRAEPAIRRIDVLVDAAG